MRKLTAGSQRMSEEGKKFDTGKPKMRLVDPCFMEGMAKILTLGADKYGEYNWRGLARSRIEDALLRHINEYQKGEKLDEESGESHLYHAACNLMFLDWFDRSERSDAD